MAKLKELVGESEVLEDVVDGGVGSDGKYKSQRLSPRRPNLERVILQGGSTSDMIDVDGTRTRGSAYYYMAIHHAVKRGNGYEIHHHRECRAKKHRSLQDVWMSKRDEMVAEEAAKKSQEIFSDTVLERIVQKYGHDPRAVQGTSLYFQDHPALINRTKSYNPEKVYCLLQDYWVSSDKGKHRTWDSLAHTAGLKYGADAQKIIRKLGLPSLTKPIGYHRRIKTTPEEQALAEKLHHTPFRAMEISCLLKWPKSHSTLQSLLQRIGPRPWTHKRPTKNSQRKVPNYVIACDIYEAKDLGFSIAETAFLNNIAISTVERYNKARHLAEPQLNNLFTIRDEVLQGRTLAEVVNA